jgi:hypothetical protein
VLALKYLLIILGLGLFGSAGALVVYDVYLSEQLRRLLARSKTRDLGAETGIKAHRPFGPVRGRLARRLALPILLALSIVVIPHGSVRVRVSQIWGARRGTLYPGVHFVTPLVDSAALYDTREQVYATAAWHQKIAQTEVCAPGSASQYPCGWLGTRCWKGGKIMSIEASTAALGPFCQEIIPPPEMRTGPLG